MEQSGLVAQTADSAEAPVTQALMESMFAALRDDLQTVKHELTTEIKDIRKDVDEVGERVATLENKEVARDTELEALQQEVIRIHDQQVDVQSYLEDLENRSHRHNIRIRGVATNEEAGDIFKYVRELFNHILGNPPDAELKIDRAHRVGPPRPMTAPPADILVCIQDFQTKEEILCKARSLRQISFRNQTPTLYQDLSAITLQKRRLFRPITETLRQRNIPYSWGHPFRLIFRHNSKLYQLRSLSEASKLLGITLPEDTSDGDRSDAGPSTTQTGWQQQRRCRRRVRRPDPTTVKKEQQAVLEALPESLAKTSTG